MLKNTPLLIAAACILCTALALAQEAPLETAASASPVLVTERKEEARTAAHSTAERPAPKPTPKPSPAATSTPVPGADGNTEEASTPKPKKLSFFQRLFGGGRKRRPTPTPDPSASPTPTPSPTPRKSGRRTAATPTPTPEPTATPKSGRTARTATESKLDMPKVAGPSTPKVTASSTATKPSSEEAPVKTAATKESPAETTKAASATPTPKATPAKKTTATTKPAVTETKKAAIEPPADADPDVKERFRFDQAKEKASNDPQVKSLKAKADDASTDEDSRKALRAYNKALFEKIRRIDSSVSDRADRLEAAILRRLND